MYILSGYTRLSHQVNPNPLLSTIDVDCRWSGDSSLPCHSGLGPGLKRALLHFQLITSRAPASPLHLGKLEGKNSMERCVAWLVMGHIPLARGQLRSHI